MASIILFRSVWPLSFVLILLAFAGSSSCDISLGSRLVANENQTWLSNNGTFAFGFNALDDEGLKFQLAIWFAELPGEDRTSVWSTNINSPASKDAILELDKSGNLILTDRATILWATNTSGRNIEFAVMSENGNFVLYNSDRRIIWQSFSHPSDTLLPGQTLTVSLELTSSKSISSDGGYFSLKMLQQPTSLSLALTYNLPDDSQVSLDDHSYTNYSYWSGPDISNVTGNVVAALNEAGSFGIVYGSSSDGAVYVYKNDNDSGGLSTALNLTNTVPSVIRRLTLESNGNLRMYRWDNDVNGSRQWVSEWAAVSNPCDIAGICGNGICSLDRSKTNSSCSCLPRSSNVDYDVDQCSTNSSLTGKCGAHHENLTSKFRVAVVQQTNYYFSDSAVIVNYSDFTSMSKCGDACLSDCECVASVYGLDDEKAYCWVLRSLRFGGFEDPGSTLFVKVEANNSLSGGGRSGESDDEEGFDEKKVLVLPIVASMAVVTALLCCLLYIYIHRKRSLRRALESSLILSGAPVSFNYRDLQSKTNNFSQLLGTGGFGRVYKGALGDGTLIAVKKLDRILPHGEREFITEVKTIGSMHHMNLVRLCGYCSEGSHRLLVYEFMKNGSLDQWIFPSYNNSRNKQLDWPTRFQIALGTAQGISYFHEQCRDRIIHCDIKPENILLDYDFCPKGNQSYGMLLLEIIGGRRNLDMNFDAEEFFFPGWAFKEMTNGTPVEAVDKRLQGEVEVEQLTRALKVAFWCIQDEVSMRPSMGDVMRILEGSIEINTPPMPQAVLELIEEGLDHVYKAMKREFNHFSSFTATTHLSSQATCSHSTMSPR
ncbi:hypothetical protein Leryth_025340 [Lithospermum erythrorhizon]|nr:hypothetical protein Leryth_025340 [Lithospermum erythrorhizon]